MTELYPYSEGNLLEQRHTYFYTAFLGKAFLDSWEGSRLQAMKELQITAASPQSPTLESATERRFASLRESPGSEPLVALLIRRFELTKRVFGAYDEQVRPRDPADFRRLGDYVAFAELLESAYRRERQLPALNALLKCLDIVVAHRRDVPWDRAQRAIVVLTREREHVVELATRVDLALQ
jgi:hypothetical protein